jgi:hypothetical protein
VSGTVSTTACSYGYERGGASTDELHASVHVDVFGSAAVSVLI